MILCGIKAAALLAPAALDGVPWAGLGAPCSIGTVYATPCCAATNCSVPDLSMRVSPDTDQSELNLGRIAILLLLELAMALVLEPRPRSFAVAYIPPTPPSARPSLLPLLPAYTAYVGADAAAPDSEGAYVSFTVQPSYCSLEPDVLMLVQAVPAARELGVAYSGPPLASSASVVLLSSNAVDRRPGGAMPQVLLPFAVLRRSYAWLAMMGLCTPPYLSSSLASFLRLEHVL